MKNPKAKTCPDCKHDFHIAGDCDHCNCGESEVVRSKHYLAMTGVWSISKESKQVFTANS